MSGSIVTVDLPIPHEKQLWFMRSTAKRKVVRAGRRSGKTVAVSTLSVEKFLEGARVLYATPTAEQLDRFWKTVTRALQEPIDAGIFKKNETNHTIDFGTTEQRIKCKTAWNADTLRGDYADLLILDEWQLMDETAWTEVGAPMMLDRNGDVIFIYTPPSLATRSASKAKDPQHAAKLFAKAAKDKSGRWATFSFSSMDNPYLDKTALKEISADMSAVAYRQEIMAQDVEEAPGALWTRAGLDARRIRMDDLPLLDKIVVGVDPSMTEGGDEVGIVVAGLTKNHVYILADETMHGSPGAWAKRVSSVFNTWECDLVVAESNQGGDLVKHTIQTYDKSVPVKMVPATVSKKVRAAPIASLFEHGRGHLVGSFPYLEDELCLWMPGEASPNRLDAMVWACTELAMGISGRRAKVR